MTMRNEVLVPIAVVIANASGVAVSLAAPALLPPAQYSSFALSWAMGQFLAMAFFEWLRFPALRFSVGPDAELASGRRAVIVATYRRVVPLVLVLAAASALVAAGSGVLAILPYALIYAASQGTFDGYQAFARAARDNLVFARNWALRAVLSIAMVVAIAWATRNGPATAVALSISFPITLAIGVMIDIRKSKRVGFLGELPANWSELPRLARYGLLAAASGVVANAVPTTVRWALVDHFGKGGAAGALLAVDLSQKALAVTGLAVNVISMQNSFSAVDTGDADTIDRSNQRQITWAVAAVVPVGLLVWAMGDDVARILIHNAYRPAFVAAIGLCALASGLICIRMFAIDPLFYAFDKAGFSALGATISLLVCGVGLGVPGLHLLGTADPLSVFLVSAAAGLLASTLIAMTILKVRLPWSQLARVAIAAGAMVLVSHIVPHGGGILRLALVAALLGLVYAAITITLNVVGLRESLWQALLHATSPPESGKTHNKRRP